MSSPPSKSDNIKKMEESLGVTGETLSADGSPRNTTVKEREEQEARAKEIEQAAKEDPERLQIGGARAFYILPEHGEDEEKLLDFRILDYTEDGCFIYTYVMDVEKGEAAGGSGSNAGKSGNAKSCEAVLLSYNPVKKEPIVIRRELLQHEEGEAPSFFCGKSGDKYYFSSSNLLSLYDGKGKEIYGLSLGAMSEPEIGRMLKQYDPDGSKGYFGNLSNVVMDETGNIYFTASILRREEGKSPAVVTPDPSLGPTTETIACRRIELGGEKPGIRFQAKQNNEARQKEQWESLKNKSFDNMEAYKKEAEGSYSVYGIKSMGSVKDDFNEFKADFSDASVTLRGYGDLFAIPFRFTKGDGQTETLKTTFLTTDLLAEQSFYGWDFSKLGMEELDRTLLEDYQRAALSNNRQKAEKRMNQLYLWNRFSPTTRRRLSELFLQTVLCLRAKDYRVTRFFSENDPSSSLLEEGVKPGTLIRVPGSNGQSMYVHSLAQGGVGNYEARPAFYATITRSVDGETRVERGAVCLPESSYTGYLDEITRFSIEERTEMPKVDGETARFYTIRSAKDVNDARAPYLKITETNTEAWKREVKVTVDGNTQTIQEEVPKGSIATGYEIVFPEGAALYYPEVLSLTEKLLNVNEHFVFTEQDRKETVTRVQKTVKEKYKDADPDELDGLDDEEKYDFKTIQKQADFSTLHLTMDGRGDALVSDRNIEGKVTSAGVLSFKAGDSSSDTLTAYSLNKNGFLFYLGQRAGTANAVFSPVRFQISSNNLRRVEGGEILTGVSDESEEELNDISEDDLENGDDSGLSEEDRATYGGKIDAAEALRADVKPELLCPYEGGNILYATTNTGLMLLQPMRQRALPLDAGTFFAVLPVPGKETHMLVGFRTSEFVYKEADIMFSRYYETDISGESLSEMMQLFLNGMYNSWLTRSYAVKEENNTLSLPEKTKAEEAEDRLASSLFSSGANRMMLQSLMADMGVRFSKTDDILKCYEALADRYTVQMKAMQQAQKLSGYSLGRFFSIQSMLWLRKTQGSLLKVKDVSELENLLVQIRIRPEVYQVLYSGDDLKRYQGYEEESRKKDEYVSAGKTGGIESFKFYGDVLADIRDYYEKNMRKDGDPTFDEFMNQLMKELNPTAIVPEEQAKEDLVTILNCGDNKLAGNALENMTKAAFEELREIQTQTDLEAMIIGMKIQYGSSYGRYKDSFESWKQMSFASDKEKEAALRSLDAYKAIMNDIKESADVKDLLKERQMDWDRLLGHIIMTGGKNMLLY